MTKPQAPRAQLGARFLFGKYKGLLVKECEDYRYMKFILPSVSTAWLREAIRIRIEEIDNY